MPSSTPQIEPYTRALQALESSGAENL